MDENNNNWQMPPLQPPPKKSNPFTNKKFYIAYFIAVVIFAAVSLFFGRGLNGFMFAAWVFSIPYAIIGVIIGTVLLLTAERSRALALGILFGGMTPFIIVFTATGGCGLLVF
jgi:lysylphosphatidylglycerol synthetase-like protein (DUF2156 family)